MPPPAKKKTKTNAVERIDAGPRMSTSSPCYSSARLTAHHHPGEASVFNKIVYLAGQVAADPSKGGIVEQTTQVLKQIDDLLAKAGTDKTNILRAQIFLPDINDFAGMNSVWDTWVPAGNTPSRATVEAKLAKPEWKIEIVVTAAIP
jgi:enamine deaminase RidA (YjgF/YER057c/UK114 family)